MRGPSDEVLAIFQGPDTYISPSWYASKAEHGKVVPTWNYAVVHAYGRLAVFDDKEWLRDFLPQLTAVHEARFEKPWQVGDAPEDYLDKMMGGDRRPGARGRPASSAKWKVGQNQPAANQATLLDGLRKRKPAGQPGAQAIAQLLAAHDRRCRQGADPGPRAPPAAQWPSAGGCDHLRSANRRATVERTVNR